MYELAQDKWVTFEDLVDDAMEGGKLSPMHMRSCALKTALQNPRRYSITGNTDLGSFRNQPRYHTKRSPFSKSTSMSSNNSCDSDSNLFGHSLHIDPPPSKDQKQRRFMYSSNNITDFSQTFPGISRDFSNVWTSDTKNIQKDNTDQSYLEKVGEHKIASDTSCDFEDFNHLRRSITMPLRTPSESLEENPFATSLKSTRTTQLARQVAEELLDDKYKALKMLKIKKGHGYTGWSTSVMGTGPFGWSDDLLNADTPSIVS